MSIIQQINGDVFEVECERVEVTSLHRLDPSWVYTDAHGHVHRWFDGVKPADDYRPTIRYDVPSLVWVKDGEEYWEEDDEPHDIGHLECRECGEHIHPRYTADDCAQYIPGLRSFYINSTPVTQEEFQRRFEDAQK